MTDQYAATQEDWAAEVKMMGECLPPVAAGQPDTAADDDPADKAVCVICTLADEPFPEAPCSHDGWRDHATDAEAHRLDEFFAEHQHQDAHINRLMDVHDRLHREADSLVTEVAVRMRDLADLTEARQKNAKLAELIDVTANYTMVEAEAIAQEHQARAAAAARDSQLVQGHFVSRGLLPPPF